MSHLEDAPEFCIERRDDGHVELTLTADATTVRLVVGRFAEDASLLAQSLRHLADDTDEIVDQWQDVADEEDGYIYFDRGRYHVSLEGTHVGAFTSQDIAEYELARAMHSGGFFPTAWLVNERGIHDNIDA